MKTCPGRGDLGQPQFHRARPSASRDDVHRIVAAQPEPLRIARIHLQPGARGEAFQDRDLARLGACMPVLHRSARIQHERDTHDPAVPGNGAHSAQMSFARPSAVVKFAVGIKPRDWLTSAPSGERPLHRALRRRAFHS